MVKTSRRSLRPLWGKRARAPAVTSFLVVILIPVSSLTHTLTLVTVSLSRVPPPGPTPFPEVRQTPKMVQKPLKNPLKTRFLARLPVGKIPPVALFGSRNPPGNPLLGPPKNPFFGPPGRASGLGVGPDPGPGWGLDENKEKNNSKSRKDRRIRTASRDEKGDKKDNGKTTKSTIALRSKKALKSPTEPSIDLKSYQSRHTSNNTLSKECLNRIEIRLWRIETVGFFHTPQKCHFLANLKKHQK